MAPAGRMESTETFDVERWWAVQYGGEFTELGDRFAEASWKMSSPSLPLPPGCASWLDRGVWKISGSMLGASARMEEDVVAPSRKATWRLALARSGLIAEEAIQPYEKGNNYDA